MLPGVITSLYKYSLRSSCCMVSWRFYEHIGVYKYEQHQRGQKNNEGIEEGNFYSKRDSSIIKANNRKPMFDKSDLVTHLFRISAASDVFDEKFSMFISFRGQKTR